MFTPTALTDYPYPSARRVIMGRRYAAATSQPLATPAGLEMFLAGGMLLIRR
jgi:gamma-glutamyltranspeptidase/glutathione hydrolase